MSRVGHVPVRTCIGCAQPAPQSTLLRLTTQPNGALTIDPSRRLGGRGGYLHKQDSCWQQFAARKGLARSLGRAIDRPARLALVDMLRRKIGA